MKLYGEFFDDVNYGVPTIKAVLFNKKRLIKVLNQDLKISDWKTFLREEYTYADTTTIRVCFDLRGWPYKINSKDSWVEIN